MLVELDTAHVTVELDTPSYDIKIPAHRAESLKYNFKTETHPHDLRLSLAMSVRDSEGEEYFGFLYDPTVSVVESEINFRDSEM